MKKPPYFRSAEPDLEVPHPPEVDPAPLLAAIAAGGGPMPPLPSTTYTLGQCEITIEGHFAVQRHPDETLTVCCPWPGSARVTSVRSTKGTVGWMWNVPGPNNTSVLGQTSALPRNVFPGDAIVIVSGSEDGGTDRPALGYAAGMSSPVDEATAVVFVGYDVREEVVGKLLRPPVWGRRGNPLVDFLRSLQWSVNVIDWSKLTAEDLVGTMPSLDFCWRQHRYFSGDVYSEWSPHVRGVPPSAHQNYGTFVSGQMGQALLRLFGPGSLEEKKPLALAILQRAIDDLGGLCDSSWRYNNGGHCQGRRAPIVLLGHLFNFEPYGNPVPFVGKRLPEDMLTTVTPWWGGAPFTGYIYSWTGDQALWARHPSTWTGDRNVAGSGERWQVMYGEQVIPSYFAAATAIHLMGRDNWVPGMMDACKSWVTIPEAAVNQLWDVGVNLHIGRGPFRDGTTGPIDYAMQPGFGIRNYLKFVQS